TLSYVLAMEEISKADASVGVIMSVNNSLVCWALSEYGTPEQKEKYLRPLAKGQKDGKLYIGAFCLSEPNAGSDATAQTTTAVRDGNAWVLNGTKNWITNGTTSELYLVFAMTDKSKGSHGISAFLVERNTPGFEILKKEKKLGIRSSDTCSLGFTDCRIPLENMLGVEGEGFKIAMKTLDGGRIGIAAQALGIAAASLERSLKYAKERKSFGKLIIDHQAIQMKLADMATELEAARMLTYEAAWRKDQHQQHSAQSAMAKLYASKIAVKAALEAVQIHGGYGYVQEYEVERYLRDSKITEIYEGTSEVQRIVIARSLLRA
ncbi:MAG: acyl-CoA dehydrogenase family protein, partial [Candidatus Thermochlorobacter sp.]